MSCHYSFRLGSNDFYPDERPADQVTVGGGADGDRPLS